MLSIPRACKSYESKSSDGPTDDNDFRFHEAFSLQVYNNMPAVVGGTGLAGDNLSLALLVR